MSWGSNRLACAEQIRSDDLHIRSAERTSSVASRGVV
jgi:hypothetical protein